MIFRILILVHMCAAFPLKCPEPAQWSIRARSHCPDPSKYFCLKNDLINGFSENCTVFDFHQPGRKSVLRGGLDADICSEERYHPWPIQYYTNVSTGCIFLKSACNEEGQVIYGNGNRSTDISCRCDYTRGYDFLQKPRNPCFCVPSEEDCSCYFKTCHNSAYILSSDYECLHAKINTSIAKCKQYIIERLNKERKLNRTEDIAEEETISIPAFWKMCIVITIAGFFIGIVLVYCILELLENIYQKDKVNDLTKEERNFIRYYLLCQTLAIETVRMFFVDYVPEPTLARHMSCLESKSWNSSSEQLALSDTDEHANVKTSDLDFYQLIRRIITFMPEPKHGWGSLPLHEDIQDEDDIERIRFYRNRLVDVTTFKLEDCDFNNWWHDLSEAIVRLSRGKLLANVNQLSRQKLDKQFKNEIVDTIRIDIEAIKNERNSLHIYDSIVQDQVLIQNDDPIPSSIRDLMEKKVQRWVKEDALFIERRATKYVLACIDKHSCISVIGPSGIGKTALCRHVALHMKRKGYTILDVSDPKEIALYFKSDRKTLYIIDDMCGNFTANQNRLEKWKDSMNDIKSCLEISKYKLILTCRLQVFQDKGFGNLDIFGKCPCNLMSKDLCLTHDEKQSMTNQYFQTHAFKALAQLSKYECLPFLCKQYHLKKEKSEFNLEKFLNDPFLFYKDDLTRMYNDCDEGKLKYCALFLLVIFNNKLEEGNLTSETSQVERIIVNITEACEITQKITGRILKSQLDTLEGTFVTYTEGFYNSVHDKLFDFLAFYFGTQTQLTDVLFKHAKARFIRERFVVTEGNISEDEESVNFLIPIAGDKFDIYIKRVFDDMIISANVNQFICGNRNYENFKFRTKLHDHMKNLDKKEKASVIETASSEFLNKICVLPDNNIKNEFIICNQEYHHYSLVIPRDMSQVYIERWFDHLTKVNKIKEYLNGCRSLLSDTFRILLRTFMSNLNTDMIVSHIQNGSIDFLSKMFVMTEDGINKYSKDQFECFGIVFTEDVIQQYFKKWFEYLMTPGACVEILINSSRPMISFAFRTALRSYIRQFKADKITWLIENCGKEFLNKMFVMAKNDIKTNAEYLCKTVGIVIPDDLLLQYIQRWFGELSDYNQSDIYDSSCRPLMNVTFRTALRSFMRKQKTEQIGALIQHGNINFLNKMFVMTEVDIKDDANRWYEHLGIVIPDSMIHRYIEKWFVELTKTDHVEEFIKNCRPFVNLTFRTALQYFFGQLKIDEITSIIMSGNKDFFNTMFVMSGDDITDNGWNLYESIGIFIPVVLRRHYIERWFTELTNTDAPCMFISKSRLFRNDDFSTAVRTYMTQLNTQKVNALIKTVNKKFFDTVFVIKEVDIIENPEWKYELIGIVIPINMIKNFIERWFYHFKEGPWMTELTKSSRIWSQLEYRATLRICIKDIYTEKSASLIQTESIDFLSRIFVVAEDDIIDNGKYLYECFGIVIPTGLLQQYIEKWVDNLAQTDQLDKVMESSRPLRNETFRKQLDVYLRHLNTEKMESFIVCGNCDFFNRMFVMTENDIKDNGDNRCECFGIVIPDGMFKQYIERWFYHLTRTFSIENFMDKSRAFKTVSFKSELHKYMKQLNTNQIASIIQDCYSNEFFNRLFVMTKNDIKDCSESQYECFGIVVPDDLLQLFVQMWFSHIQWFKMCNIFTMISLFGFNRTKEEYKRSRHGMDFRFRSAVHIYIEQLDTENINKFINNLGWGFFNDLIVMAENDINQIGKRSDILQNYNVLIELWFKMITKTNQIAKFMSDSKNLMSDTFCTALRSYTGLLGKEKIAFLIQTGNTYIFNKLFVMTEFDIKEYSERYCEWFGIVIPKYLLHQYIERLFNELTQADSVRKYLNDNRLWKNADFRTVFNTYIHELKKEQILAAILDGNDTFLNTMFVITDNDIIDNCDIRCACFGIVISSDILNHYAEMWLSRLKKAYRVKDFINEGIHLMNDTFRVCLHSITQQLNNYEICYLIKTGSSDFVNTMFVMKEDDIKANVSFPFECVGIIIPVTILNQYIEIWFYDMTQADSVKVYMDENRCLKDVEFRKALRTYISQLTKKQIAYYIQRGKRHFINTMFVMTADDIKDSAGNRYEFTCIIIPNDMLQLYFESWFDSITKTDLVVEDININRLFMNASGRTAIQYYLGQINKDAIETLIKTGNKYFINTMFVMTDDDIQKNAENRYECFGIIIPDDMLNKYIKRLFDDLTNSDSVKNCFDVNRCLMNVIFRKALQTFIKHKERYTIEHFIQHGSTDFVNTMFVIAEDDIKEDSENRIECFGIILPDNLLYQYIERWFDGLTKTDSAKQYIDGNKTFTNFKFQTKLDTYINGIDAEKIALLNRKGHIDYLNTRRDLLKENSTSEIKC